MRAVGVIALYDFTVQGTGVTVAQRYGRADVCRSTHELCEQWDS